MSPADGGDTPFTARRSVAALTRVPSIPRRNQREAMQGVQKRAAIVLRRGMKQTEFRHVEAQLAKHMLTSLPVLVAQKRGAVADTPVCGLIVTGGDMAPTQAEHDMILDAVRVVRERDLPVLALSDAAALACEALNIDLQEGGALALLIDGDVRPLTTQREIDDAIKLIARAPQR